MTHYYDLCCKYRGQVVTIYEKCGKVHVGKIVNVDHQFVYIEPVSGGVAGYGWGLGWGWGFRPFFPIALAAIGGLALGASLFWI
ncbi:hypothetical protein AWH56_009895 [Anaerobacillus isosaccharinicus]|uniref:Uncharacterized protein n=1 Tax=Anaerobacillus isosaccharinicus TaxID=1532552 RepID=A0A7S7LBH7_9BACI|nr:hypothetical protein [Anaerobacillus isosaccharinicus]MBA5588760.1 hypothetical protein [Anaerobacillus isosaccharinicus]QOY37840.1 hypothetical protein AWH56_009895 [Anaerobacillus isosaccharinicus]